MSVVISIVVERPDREQHLCVDKAYDAADFREFLVLEGITPHIKHNPRGSKNFEPSHTGLGESTYPARRWVVERTLSWLAKRRSIRTRFRTRWSKKASNWLALVQFACAHILFRMGSQETPAVS